MKVNFKRVATAALAVAMSLSLSVPAFAEGNGGDRTLTVTGDTLDNKDVYAVQMFTAHATGTDSVVFDNYELADDSWLAFFRATTENGGLNMPGADADAARKYVEELKDASLVTFADKAQAWVRKHSTEFVVIVSDSEESPVADQAKFTELQAGYYLVYPEGGSTGTENRGTDAMLVNVPRDNNAEWDIKSTFPTVDKKVDTNETVDDTHDDATDNGSAQVGDTVTFTLKSTVPDMSDYTTFYFGFTDTLTRGLKIVDSNGSAVSDGNPASIDNLTITIGGEPVTSGYNVSLQGTVLKVEFTNLKNVEQANQDEDIGKDIVVTYQAMITEAAVVGTPALNTVKVEYSNDPTTGTKGESTPDESKVYTYDIDVNKWALSGKEDEPGTDEDESKIKNLADAEFILSTNQTAPTEEQIKGEYANYNGLVKLFKLNDNSYRVAKPDDTPKENSFTTTNSGDINIAGLEAGTYYLHEIEAPDGYNKLKKPVKIEIIVSEGKYENATIEVNDGVASGDNVINVENKKGIELPETGSIGTIGLTALGVVVVVAGLFAFPRKKKTRQD